MVLNVISLQYNRLTALVHCCWSGHSHWDVKVTDVAPKSPLINIYPILRARWYKSASFYLLETKVEKNWLQTLIWAHYLVPLCLFVCFVKRFKSGQNINCLYSPELLSTPSSKCESIYRHILLGSLLGSTPWASLT